MGEGKHVPPRFPASPPLRPSPYYRSHGFPPFPVPGPGKASSSAALGQRRSWPSRQLRRQQRQYQQEGRRRRPWSGAAGGRVLPPQCLSRFVGGAVCGRSYVCGLALVQSPLLLLAACCLFLCFDEEDFLWFVCLVCVLGQKEGGRGGREGRREGRERTAEAVHHMVKPCNLPPYSLGASVPGFPPVLPLPATH